MKQFFKLTQIAISVIMGILFPACERDADRDYDFTKTSWESKVDHDGVSGSLIISFTTGENGIIKEDVQNGDGAEYTCYSVFTYTVEKGEGTLHVNGQYCFREDKMVAKMLYVSDAHFTMGNNSNVLEFNDGENSLVFKGTEFQPIPIPATDTPDNDGPDIILNYNMLMGKWESAAVIFQECSFNFYTIKELAQPRFANVHVGKNDIFRPGGFFPVVHDTMLYPEIGASTNTVAIYDNWSSRNIMFYLVFEEYDEDLRGYWVTFEDASHNCIAYDCIVKR